MPPKGPRKWFRIFREISREEGKHRHETQGVTEEEAHAFFRTIAERTIEEWERQNPEFRAQNVRTQVVRLLDGAWEQYSELIRKYQKGVISKEESRRGWEQKNIQLLEDLRSAGIANPHRFMQLFSGVAVGEADRFFQHLNEK